MFSGIIEKLAPVTMANPVGGSLEIELVSGFADLALGESIAVNVCLTVTQFDATARARLHQPRDHRPLDDGPVDGGRRGQSRTRGEA